MECVCPTTICEQFEKRGNIAQNAKFWHFSSYHHFKAVRVSDFILHPWALNRGKSRNLRKGVLLKECAKKFRVTMPILIKTRLHELYDKP